MMNEDASPFNGDLNQDLETAKRLIGAYPNVNVRSLITIAADRNQPESSRIAAIYTLGFTDDRGKCHELLNRIVADPKEPLSIRDHAAEALEHLG